jgi:hypothetical protein
MVNIVALWRGCPTTPTTTFSNRPAARRMMSM